MTSKVNREASEKIPVHLQLSAGGDDIDIYVDYGIGKEGLQSRHLSSLVLHIFVGV